VGDDFNIYIGSIGNEMGIKKFKGIGRGEGSTGGFYG